MEKSINQKYKLGTGNDSAEERDCGITNGL